MQLGQQEHGADLPAKQDVSGGCRFAGRVSLLSLDEGDKLLKCAKAFGKDAKTVRAWARACRVPQDWDAQVPSIAIPLDRLREARKACPKAVFAESANVFEDREGRPYLRELGVRETEGGEDA